MIPEKATSLHIKMEFAMASEGVSFRPAEATVKIAPSDPPEESEKEAVTESTGD